MRPRAAITLAGVVYSIGADFRRAMVATAAGEKLLIGRRGEELDPDVRHQACFCAENYICSPENQRKLFDSNMH